MMHSGCSMISLSMKCLYAPFAAETGSYGTCCGVFVERRCRRSRRTSTPPARDAGDLAVGEERDALRLGQHGGEVAGDEHLAVAVADDDAAGVADARGDDRGRARCARHARRSRARPRAGAMVRRNAVSRSSPSSMYVSMRWGMTSVSVSERSSWPRALQLGAQLEVVLDDAVVDDDDVAAAVAVRVGVVVGRLAVRGPARVADAGATGGIRALEPAAQRRRACRRPSRCGSSPSSSMTAMPALS